MNFKTTIILLLFCFFYGVSAAQKIQLDTLYSKALNQISVKPLFTDSLVSSFLIEIPSGGVVPLHLHKYHAEHVLILSGNANMILNRDTLKVQPNQLIFIPRNTPHKVWVTSKEPLRVVSLQAPKFTGIERKILE
ncbi:MAG: cupin domain-containing protein [Luteibaculaceae bacterium]